MVIIRDNIFFHFYDLLDMVFKSSECEVRKLPRPALSYPQPHILLFSQALEDELAG